MVVAEVMGMLLVATAACFSEIGLVMQTVMTGWNMPFHCIVGTSELLFCIPLFVLLCMRGELYVLHTSTLKWIWFRGFFGTLQFVLPLLAIHNGAPIGDVSALGSINVVVAAALGRIFLGEALNALHVCAICLSVAGAFVITKPEALLALKQVDGGVPWLGYLLALASGFATGGLFIASRKSKDTSSLVMTLSVLFQEGLSLFLLVFTGLVVEHPVAQILAAPLEAAGCLALMTCTTIVTVFSMNLGSQKCPAAMSSTIYTSLQLTVGYVSQALIAKKVPDMHAVLGAMLMLVAVALMAFTRWKTSSQNCATEANTGTEVEVAPGQVTLQNENGSGDASVGSIASDAYETESLASFVAKEFSGLTPSSESVRQRHTRVVATIVGAAVDPAA